MTEDDRVSIGEADLPLDLGNADGIREYDDDLLDIGRDFGKDMEWTGEAIGNTWESVGDRIDNQTSEGWESAKSDFSDGNYLEAAGDVGLFALEDVSTVVAGTIGTVADAALGIGATGVAALHDVYDAAADIGNATLSGIDSVLGTDLVGDVDGAIDWVEDGVESAGSAIAEGVEDAIDAIGDLF